MSIINPFDLLGDDDSDDVAKLIAIQEKKLAAKTAAAPAPAPAAKLPMKPTPPAQAVREARNNSGPMRGGDRAGRGGPGRGRGGRGAGGIGGNRDFGNANGNANGYSEGYGHHEEVLARNAEKDRERVPYGQSYQATRGGGRRGGYGGGYGNEEGGGEERLRRGYEAVGDDRQQRRQYDRHSGTGRASGFKREGGGPRNWGTMTDDVLAQETTEESINVDEKIEVSEKLPEGDVLTEASKENKETPVAEAEVKEEDKEMTLEEYEKILEEKRKALLAMKAEERKVEVDKELEAMQLLSVKKQNDEIFIKLSSDKDGGKKKENTDRTKKPVSIQEFLKPAEGERYFGGRGRGRGRGDRGPVRGGFGGGGTNHSAPTPSIEDQRQFPTLGAK